ncbi:MAG: hypothetical protein LBJ11_02215 [Oscillospiraceae bacterium]|jgi:hypothetical protein|nr:hypothetical protein [Oscillospiraceae bacterium]
MKLVHTVAEVLRDVSPAGRRLLRLALPTLLLLYLGAIFLWFSAGRWLGYVGALDLSQSLTQGVRGALGLLMVGFLLLEAMAGSKK